MFICGAGFRFAPQFFQTGDKGMKYTIIFSDRRTPVIQQQYDKIEDAEKRFAELEQKSAKHYPIVIVGIDEDGAYHDLAKKEESTEGV